MMPYKQEPSHLFGIGIRIVLITHSENNTRTEIIVTLIILSFSSKMYVFEEKVTIYK